MFFSSIKHFWITVYLNPLGAKTENGYSAELYAVRGAHGADAGQRFHTHTAAADQIAAGLERFFDADPRSDDLCAGLRAQVDQPSQRRSVGKEIIDEQYPVG